MTEAHQQQRYRVIERLASGGMAEVFRAESAGIEGFKKQVAIKRVLPHLSEKKRFIAMFLDEARLSAHLSHSNVAQVFDIGVGDNAYFIVMEYVDGADLKAVIEWMKKSTRPIPVEAAVFITAKICEGLTYAHELKDANGVPFKIVHRDMSPPNVLITKYGEVKIVDFGLAKATSQLEKSEAGIIKGKFSYLSPEAAQGLDVDQRTDIFAAGIILWEMLAGRRLFLGDSDYQTVKMVQEAKIPPLSSINKDVPPDLDRILARALAQDPAKRYATARELGTDLIAFLYKLGRPVSAYDIAEMVRGAMTLRRRPPPGDKASLIDKLIEEALLEFTSLQDDDKAAPAAAKSDEPVKLQEFHDLSKWVDEINVSGTEGGAIRKTIATPEVEAGNLAALEDDEVLPASAAAPLAPAKPAKPAAAQPQPRPVPPKSAALASAEPDRDSTPQLRSGGGAVKALLLVAALAILAAGAWFGGLIPH
ncbi:MAG: serine/threonine protein kinase [Polyangiaceae bacterium]|nr:serine/threonine protein kinase [Polyangiaceae bacterium]